MSSRLVSPIVLLVAALATQGAIAQGLEWTTDLASAQRTAAQTNRLVLVHFGGTWCGPCQRMEAEVFAKHLSAYLEKEGALRKFDRLALIAPPSFLGILRKNLSKSLSQKITQEIPKDLPSTWVSAHHLKMELRDTLDLP